MTSVMSHRLLSALVPNYNISLRICVHFLSFPSKIFSKLYFSFRHFPYFCHIYTLYYSHKMKEQTNIIDETQALYKNEPGSRLSAGLWQPGSTNNNSGKPEMTYIVV